MKTVQDIRHEFLSYFNGKGHEVVPASPLVPQNDPSLMFVNSGMVQFKDIFTGKENRPYSRATTSQKSVRAGGKHNDLDNVGYTARHHTFFEMLGNFSFGDYFKEDAIPFAWELLTKNFGIDKSKLLVTVYHEDEEAANIWKKVAGLSDDRIIRIATSDNFWMMGDTGPCGPCSEIFYDHGEDIPGGPPGSPDEDGDRFIEIWNLVFMQYEQQADGSRINLPKPSIDTGMGLERFAAIMQGVHSNYEIDLMQAIINHISDATGEKENASHRVIADHLRASAFLIADGVMPSNEGRGYVLRRIMRRGMRHAHILGAQDPLMHQLFPTLQSLMHQAYPELDRAQALITETLKSEEERFKRTLDKGLKLLDDETKNLGEGDTLDGTVAFKLYDTYGFPVDLTADALRGQNMKLDMDGFNAAMEKQKEAARANWSGSGEAATEQIWFELDSELPATEFLGYDVESAQGEILAIVTDGARANSIKEGESGYILTNQTPFYGESGGQVGDTGTITSEDGTAKAIVTDTLKKRGRLFVHQVTMKKGTLSINGALQMNINTDRRAQIKANHSATHLMHEALRRVLGEHVTQKGSLQDEARTRFDISHTNALTPEQIAEVENIVNAEIRANTALETRLLPIDQAMEMGAMALFGEKYDDEVRVLFMGTWKKGDNKPFSVELCGGTHVTRTGDIGLFKIISQSSVSAGVRRIEAVTGANALAYYEEQDQLVQTLAHNLKTTPHELETRIQSLIDERKKLEQEVTNIRKQMASGGGISSANDDVKDINGIKFIAKILPDFPAKDLKPMADDLKQSIGSGVVALLAINEGKASLVVGVTTDLNEKISAVDLVKTGASALGGQGGGGRPDMAQAGGPNADAANDAISAIESAI